MLPLLLLVLAGIVNFGVIFSQKLALDNAARQGARWGVVDGRTTDQIKAETKKILVAADGSGTLIAAGTTPVTITVTGGGAAAKPCQDTEFGTNITVRATFQSKYLIPMPFKAPLLTGSGNFQCEYA